MRSLLQKLDLADYIHRFEALYARPKPIYIEGDRALHFRFVNALAQILFKSPPPVKNLEDLWMRLQKSAVASLNEIFEVVKMIRYFDYLKKLPIEGEVAQWLETIRIEPEMLEISERFDDEGRIKESSDERLASLSASLKHNQSDIKESLRRLFGASKLQPYLVDRQIHYVNNEEALLVRGGFNHVIKGSIIGRTPAGFFYLLPASIEKLKDKESQIASRLEEVYYEIAKTISRTLKEKLPFLKFLDKCFDRFDHYQARVMMAKHEDLLFVLPKNGNVIRLKEFCHPALEDPKPVTIDFSKNILMITGVNAGGKTMLLKSILAAAWLAKYLLPMRTHVQTVIGSFKAIEAVIEDPQNVKNDISTFAGRMREFAGMMRRNDVLLGIDEIELGTDSDEAASLFKVMLEHLVRHRIKIVVTTHHKRLASMMASRPEVELIAAVFDQKLQAPTYTFLHGIIGKSYAFETALRYGIPASIVEESRKVHGEDKERLNELIERSSTLEQELIAKRERLEHELHKAKEARERLKEQQNGVEAELNAKRRELEAIYGEATAKAREAAKAKDARDIHRNLNNAHKTVSKAVVQTKQPKRELKIGDRVKYRKNRGVIIALKANEATIEVEGMKMRVPRADLKPSGNVAPTPASSSRVKVERTQPGAGVTLDLHGQRADEAVANLDKFLSDALLAGFDEVLVYHGIGTGKLAYAVREFLKTHPSVKSYGDAPQKMGGFGATLVNL